MAVPYIFATATSSIPLSQLDSNFATPITLGNTSIQLGNTVTTLNNMTLANVTVSSVASTFPNNYLANSTATLGNATITLGGTTSTVGNLTLTNATISSGTYSVTDATVSGNLTLSGGTANGVAYLNGSKVLTTGSALVFDGSNLGLGVTPSAWGAAYKALQLSTKTSLSQNASDMLLTANAYNNGSSWLYLTSSYATTYVQSSTGQHQWYNASSGTAGNTISFTQAMTLDANGNLGVGSTSPNIGGVSKAVTLNTTNGSSGAIYEIAANGTNYAYFFANATNTVLSSVQNLPLLFNTNNTERARITSAGEFYIAGTTDQGAYNLQVAGTGVWGAGAYVNGSDARIKEEIAPIDSGLDVVQKLNPVTYKYKEDWTKDRSTQTGFIAQELLVALEGKNYVDGVVTQGGSEGYYSVAYQNIIPILTKAIQELNAKVEAQAAEIAALKSK